MCIRRTHISSCVSTNSCNGHSASAVWTPGFFTVTYLCLCLAVVHLALKIVNVLRTNPDCYVRAIIRERKVCHAPSFNILKHIRMNAAILNVKCYIKFTFFISQKRHFRIHQRHYQFNNKNFGFSSTRLNHEYKNLDVICLNINNNNMPHNRILLETKQRIIDAHNEG